ncbi:YveK family protein [Patescibacteria group bacterium]
MENLKYSKIIKQNWEIVALIVGVTIVFALIVSLIQPFQFAASTKILIIQKQERNLDAYTATKSAERIGKNLVNIIYTSSFYNEVISANSEIVSKFPTDSVKRRKMWNENIKVSVIPETGILEVKVYDVDRKYASELVKTIAFVLVDKGADYHGGGTDVEIKIVDDVFISKYPVRPNIFVNLALAVIIGVLLGSGFVVLNETSQNPLIKADENKTQPAPVKQGASKRHAKVLAKVRKDPFEQRLSQTSIVTMHDHI